MVTGGDDAKVNLWAVGKPNCIMVSEESDGDVHGKHSLASKVDDLVGNFSRDSFRQFQLFTKYYCFLLKWKCTMICFSAMKMVMCCSFLVAEKLFSSSTVTEKSCYRVCRGTALKLSFWVRFCFFSQCRSTRSLCLWRHLDFVGHFLSLSLLHFPFPSPFTLFTYSQPHTVQSCPCSACTHTHFFDWWCAFDCLPAALRNSISKHRQTLTLCAWAS